MWPMKHYFKMDTFYQPVGDIACEKIWQPCNADTRKDQGHGTTEITDPVEEMLKKTGCLAFHYKVQECIAESQDWRKCQNQVTEFKKCMDQYNVRRKQDTK